ncbi:TPA: IS200/IS605 family accessory protein TnpB-related protein [Citrobacter freundii]
MANSDTRTLTINTKIKSSAFTAEELSFLDVYLNHYNHIKFITTSKIKKKSLDGLKIADVKSLCDKNDVLPYRIFNAGLFQQVQGQIKSQLSNKKNYLDNVQDKIKSVENKLQKQINTIKLISSMTPVMRSYAANRTRLSEAVKKKTVFLNQLERLRCREHNLEKDIANNDFKICYGSADLLSKRNRIHPNDKVKLSAWRKQWNALRYGHMLFVGSTDENLGNSNANISINKNNINKNVNTSYLRKNNEFTLNITVPVALKKQFSFSKLSVPITVSYYKDELRNHILFHREGKVKYTKAQKEAAKTEGRTLVSPTSSLSIRLMRNSKGDFDIGIGLQTSHDIKPAIKTVENYGLIGVDINPDHLDVAETDEKGNYLRGWSVPLDLKDKSTKQRKTVLSQATKGIVDYALSVGKSIVTEDLDFTKKKKALKNNYNKNYARMLSAFAYGKIREYITGQCWKSGVNLLTVNPAYTSFLGNLKYRTKITTKNNEHMPAAYVIARRGQGFRERIPSSILKIKKDKTGVITAERISLRKMVFDAGAASGWSKLKHLHKTVSQRGESIDLNTGPVLSKISFLMLGSTGIPLCQEMFISSRYASGNESLK